jgi:hypothetical protein
MSGQRTQDWRGGPPRFSEERKPRVERPSVMDYPLYCWCGEQHGGEGNYKHAGIHPWGPLPELEDRA